MRIKTISRLAATVTAVALAGTVLAGCNSGTTASNSSSEKASSSAEVTVTTVNGEQKQIKANPKVVVFDLTTLDMLLSVGVKPIGIPDTSSLPEYIKKDVQGIPQLGDMREPNAEKIAELNPELIIVGGRSKDAGKDLSKITTTIDLSDKRKNLMDDIKLHTDVLGPVFTKSSEMDQKTQDIQATIDQLKTKASTAGKGLTISTSGGKVYLYGKGSRFGLPYDPIGMAEAKSDIPPEGHGQEVSFETVGQANPDKMFVIDRDAAIGKAESDPAQKVLDTPLVTNTNAWKNNKVYYLDGATWYIMGNGFTTATKMLEELAPAFDA